MALPIYLFDCNISGLTSNILYKEKIEKPRAPRNLASPKPVKTPKLKYSVAEICFFLNIREYPMIINGNTRSLFQDYVEFEKFYLLRLVTINDFILPPLQMLCRAKWREIEAVSDNIECHDP